MLGATMASISDGCISEQRDPCASPPCKRLKQVALPVECIVIEDSNESTTGPLTNQTLHAEAPTLNETTTSENQPIESVSHTEQCMKNSDVASMETEGLESQLEHKSEVLPQLPVMFETKSDVKSISVNNSNGTMLNGNGASNSSMNAETNGDEKEVPSCIPPKGKDSATLLKFFKPVTPGSKNTIVENMKKTPSKNDGKTVLKNNNKDVVISSPRSPVNTSPDTLEMTGIKKTPSPPPASSDDKTTPRRKTPGRKLSVEEKQKREEERLRKQKEKEALEKERLEKKKEKERLREERLKEKMEAKQKKEQERSEQQEMKKQRERERIEKKEQDEKERKEKLEKKEAEKKKKEDEKNLKNEEKRRKEEEEMLKKKKAMNSFAKFFIKKEATVPAKPKEQVPKQSKFQPFELKPFMKLASTPYRKPLSENDRQQLSRTIVEQVTTSLREVKKELLALREIAREIKREDEQTEAQRATDKGDDDIMIIDDDDVCSDSKTQKESTEQELSKVKAKLLQFHENYRPAYFGSWRKNSSSVGPRTPFKKDEVLMNYEVDSDEEWEEEEPGESLSNSEGEDEDESGPNEDEDDQDGFFVPHGYLSDDEGDADGKDDAMEQVGEKISQLNSEDKMERHLAKQKTWEAELKRQFKPMKPVAIGCVWEEEMPTILKQLEACCMLAVDSIDPTTARKEHQENAVNSSPTTTATYCNTAMPVPEEAMPFLIKMLHGSVAGLQKLVRLFRKRWTLETNKADSRVSEETWEQHCTVSKRQVERKITAIANKEIRPPTPKPRWYVGSKILALYRMENIELATNGLIPTVFASKEKSTSPVLQKRILQTKSPIISSFSNTKDAPIAKVNGIIEEKKSDDIEVVSMDTTPPVRLE